MDNLALHISKEEQQFLEEVLFKILPLQGTLETLPSMMQKVADLIKKIKEAKEE